MVIDGWGGESGEYQLNINYPMELGQVVVFESQEDNNAIKNFTIQNGNAPYGGGIFLSNYSNPILQNLTITNNYANNGGGIAVNNGSSPTLTNVSILTILVVMKVVAYMYSEDSHLKIRNCTIENNVSTNQGGGLWSQGAMIT